MITRLQIKKIHILLHRLGINCIDIKQSLVSQYSANRVQSTTGLHSSEADSLIMDLERQLHTDQDYKAADRKRKLLIHHAHQMGWKLTSGAVDMKRLDGWCRSYGYLHKGLNQYTAKELSILIVQFEKAALHYQEKKS